MRVTINNKSTTTEQPPKNGQQPKPLGGGGLNAFYWYQFYALDSAVVEVQEMFSSHGSLLTIAMHHHGELTHYNETKKGAHDSQIVRAKENLK